MTMDNMEKQIMKGLKIKKSNAESSSMIVAIFFFLDYFITKEKEKRTGSEPKVFNDCQIHNISLGDRYFRWMFSQQLFHREIYPELFDELIEYGLLRNKNKD
jgi:hypothetical protein